MKTLLNLSALLIAIIFLSCGRKNKTEHAHVTILYTCSMHPQIVQANPGTCPICGMVLVKKSTGTNDDSIMLNETQMELANIKTTVAHLQPVGETTQLEGKLMMNENATEVVSSRVSGRIEKLYFKEVGQRVEQGQLLYEIYSEQLLTLQQEYLLTCRQYEEIKQSRYELLVKAAEKKLALLGMTTEQIEQLTNEKKSTSRMAFHAPTSGVIDRIAIAEGEYVSEGSELFRMQKLNQLWVEAELYGHETSLVKLNDRVRVQVSGFENEPIEGKIIFISPEFRKGSQLITLRALIDNQKQNYLAGMHAIMTLTPSPKKVIALPVDAVIRDAHGSQLWIEKQKGIFQPREVKTGIENVENVEITQGLKENERVVISGAYRLYSERIFKQSIIQH